MNKYYNYNLPEEAVINIKLCVEILNKRLFNNYKKLKERHYRVYSYNEVRRYVKIKGMRLRQAES